jgi:hypothetical protein
MVTQQCTIPFNVIGDGVSTQQFVDLTKALESPYGFSPFQNSPAGDIVVLVTPTMTVSGVNYTSTAYVIKSVVVITWSAPVPLGLGGAADIVLGY